MNIGTPVRTTIVRPATIPVPQREREREIEQPLEVPQHQPEQVPVRDE